MACKSKHPSPDAMPRSAVVQLDTPARTSGGLMDRLATMVQDVLVVTYWFEPVPHPEPYPVTVRFSGRRVDVKGRLSPRDRFSQDETIEKVVPGSGPISLTARIQIINPGEWVVTAHMLGSVHSAYGLRKQETVMPTDVLSGSILRFWHTWAPSVESTEQVKTCLTPFAHVPGILPGMWGAMVTLGMAVALLLQFLVIARDHLVLGPWWVVSLGAILIGIIGAKVWYIVQYRREHLINGWCIQGFVTCATLAAAILLVVLHIPFGVFLDVTAPGLLVAMAVGRIGCFFAGCCGGPPTASSFGLWSSDQRVGAHRIPTQLLELMLTGTLGLGVLVAVLGRGPAGGAFFVGGLAAYTLVRQGILHLRAEPRRTRYGGQVTASLAALILIATVVFLAR